MYLLHWHILCVFTKKCTLQSASPHHSCIQRNNGKGRTKIEKLLQQSTTWEMQAMNRDQNKLSHPLGLPFISGKMKRWWYPHLHPVGAVKCSAQVRMIHSRWLAAAVSTVLNCPCLYQLGRVGSLKISFRSSTVSFFQLFVSIGAKLHTDIPAQLVKHPHRKYLPQRGYKSFSPTFFPNKEVKKKLTSPVNTAGGSTKGSSKFFHLLTSSSPLISTLFFSFPFHSDMNMKIQSQKISEP